MEQYVEFWFIFIFSFEQYMIVSKIQMKLPSIILNLGSV